MKEGACIDFDSKVEVFRIKRNGCYIGSQKEFYNSVRKMSLPELLDLTTIMNIKETKKSKGIFGKIGGSFLFLNEHEMLHKKTNFLSRLDDVDFNLEMILRGNATRMAGKSFNSLDEIPSENPMHMHYFEKAGKIYHPDFPEETYPETLIYKCYECDWEVVDCFACGYAPLRFLDLIKMNNREHISTTYECNHCGLSLGTKGIVF